MIVRIAIVIAGGIAIAWIIDSTEPCTQWRIVDTGACMSRADVDAAVWRARVAGTRASE